VRDFSRGAASGESRKSVLLSANSFFRRSKSRLRRDEVSYGFEMSRSPTVAIVGGGPAGALAGALLAESGRDVHLFDEKLAWEKPCGGGLTHKALQRYRFLAEAGTESNAVENCELISPSGQKVRLRMQHPVAIFSRLALNRLVLERAERAGANIHRARVTRLTRIAGEWQLSTPHRDYRASSLVLAAGARNSFRSQFVSPIAPSDLMVTAGYFIPGLSSLMQIQFLKAITGYIWVFPRADHVSAGIAGKMGDMPTSELRRVLELCAIDRLRQMRIHSGARALFRRSFHRVSR